MLRRFLLVPLLLVLAATLPAQEVQRHGLVFEQWVRESFFGGYRPKSYTQRWDIPAEVNRDHGGVPVNPKAAKHGTPVDLGDAVRQYEIDVPFILLLGFWRQEGDFKRFTNLLAPRITPEQWRRLWAPIAYADLLKLDAVVKDPALSLEEARREVLRIKSAPPFTQAIIQVNPKIDARQRRLQCSLRFADVFKHLAPEADPEPQAAPSLWGKAFPGPIASPPRN